MSDQHDPFLPHSVDESIEYLTSTNQTGNSLSGPIPINATGPDVRLIHELQKLYGSEHTRYLQALQRVEDRLVEQRLAQAERPAVFPIQKVQQQQSFNESRVQQERLDRMNMKKKQSSTSNIAKLSLLVASLLLIVSMAAVFSYVRQGTTTGAVKTTITATRVVKAKHTPTSTPTSIGSFGKTLYTTPPASQTGFSSLSWSPDSKRVASFSNLSTGVQIWDATTGNHLLTVKMPGTYEWPTSGGVAWAPNSQLVAVATNQHIRIINGQTGQIVLTYGANPRATAQTTSSSKTFLSSQFPSSDGSGYYAPSWSPDGRFISVVASSGPSAEEQVLNAQTSTLAFTLSVSDSSYEVGAPSWSSDGQYIAATAMNIQGTSDPSQPNGMIVVWKVSTHQIVFQHKDFVNGTVRWQPHSYDLAFEGTASSEGASSLALVVWNVMTGKLVKQYTNGGDGGFDWSPDGKYLAYASDYDGNPLNKVIIMDVNTDKQVYAYKGHQLHISVVAWSPSGKYIASGEGNTQGNMVAKVWTAL